MPLNKNLRVVTGICCAGTASLFIVAQLLKGQLNNVSAAQFKSVFVWTKCARTTQHQYQVSHYHFCCPSNTVFPPRPQFNAVSFLKHGVAVKQFIAGHKMWLASMERSHSWKARSCWPVQEFFVFYVTRRFIIIFTKAHYLSVFSAT